MLLDSTCSHCKVHSNRGDEIAENICKESDTDNKMYLNVVQQMFCSLPQMKNMELQCYEDVSLPLLTVKAS